MADKRVSLDEYLHAKGAHGLQRKQFARDNGVVLKAAHAEGEKRAKYTKGSGRMAFVMSAEIEDRDRDIVIQAGLDTASFEKNPVAPWAHRSGDFPVGKWENLQKFLTGRPKRTEGELALTMADPNAQRLEAHWAAGSLIACSIGFMPKEIERRDVPDDMKGDYYYPGYIIHSADLYECSPCSIPANPAALAKAAADGDVLSREIIEEVLDNWKVENGLLMPRKAFEDAHREATGERTGFVIEGERYVAFKNARGALSVVKAADVKKGDFVSWGSSGGTARGKVDSIKTDGTIEVPGATVTGTQDDPAAKITVWKQADGKWAATDTKVAHKVSTLTKIDALKSADEADSGDVDEQVKGLLSKLLTMVGLKGKTAEAADPAPQQGGKKPAPEPTPEQKLRSDIAKDLPALEARHKLLEADAREAALDAEMAHHRAA